MEQLGSNVYQVRLSDGRDVITYEEGGKCMRLPCRVLQSGELVARIDDLVWPAAGASEPVPLGDQLRIMTNITNGLSAQSILWQPQSV